MINTELLEKYIAQCRKELGGDTWVTMADAAIVTGSTTVGELSKRYAIMCYMNDVSAKDCVKKIKEKFPEGSK